MNEIKIQLFGGFQVMVNGRELPLAPSAKETLALLTVAGGKRVTAKAVWKILYDYKKVGYDGRLYTRRINDVKSELEVLRISDIITHGAAVVRFCSINQNVVKCDYYEMLDGNIPFADDKDFLPEYEWAKVFYKENWHNLYQYWDSLKC